MNQGGVTVLGVGVDLLTIHGDLTFADGAGYEWELGSAASDTLSVNGILTLSSTATLQLVDVGGTPDPLMEYTLITYTGPDPSNPVWTLDKTAASGWDESGANIFVDVTTNRVVLTVLDVLFAADFDNVGDVDGVDFPMIQRNAPSLIPQWGTDYGNGVTLGSDVPSQAVPEPSSLLLILLSAGFWIARPCLGKLAVESVAKNNTR